MSTCDLLPGYQDSPAPQSLDEKDWKVVRVERDALTRDEDARLAVMFAIMEEWDEHGVGHCD